MPIARPFAVGLAVTAVLACGVVPALAAPTPTPTPGATRPAASAKASIKISSANSQTDPFVFTVTGLTAGQQVEASAGRRDDAQAETTAVAQADASGKAVLRLPAPQGGWRLGETYYWGVSTGHTGHFTYATDDASINEPTAKPSSKSSKAPTGGLAKTGV